MPNIGGQCGDGRADEKAGHAHEKHRSSAVAVGRHPDDWRQRRAHDGGDAVGQRDGALTPSVLVLERKNHHAEGLGYRTAAQVKQGRKTDDDPGVMDFQTGKVHLGED